MDSEHTQRLCFFSFRLFFRAPLLDSELLLRCLRFFFPLECLCLVFTVNAISPLFSFTIGTGSERFLLQGVILSPFAAPFPGTWWLEDNAEMSSSSRISYFCPEESIAHGRPIDIQPFEGHLLHVNAFFPVRTLIFHTDFIVAFVRQVPATMDTHTEGSQTICTLFTRVHMCIRIDRKNIQEFKRCTSGCSPLRFTQLHMCKPLFDEFCRTLCIWST